MLSKKTKYAINALVYLSHKFLEHGRNPVLIDEVSKHERIPKKFLEAILLELKNQGILGSKKGKGGGYYMLKEPKEVSLDAVMRIFNGAIALLPCTSQYYYERCDECKDEATCGIRDVFKEVRDKTVEILSKCTLADVMQREGNLKALLKTSV
jgi:Rrf2 family protein